MTPERLAAIYCVLIVLASLAGGWLPRLLHLTHSRMQVAISFVAGVVLGIGVLHLAPHGYFQWQESAVTSPIDNTVWWLLVGFLTTFFLQRLFHFHSHAAPEDEHHDHEHDVHIPMQGNVHHHVHGPECRHDVGEAHAVTWGGVLFGLTVHSLVDGVTLAAAVAADWDHAETVLAGIGYFLAVLLHKPFDSLSITSLMIASGWSSGWRNAINLLYALVVPAGVALFYLGLQQAGESTAAVLGGTLCFAAGACLCISSSDLLPELQFHSHDRLKLSVALVLGLALAWGLVYVENQGHPHHHHPSLGGDRGKAQSTESHGHKHGDVRDHEHDHNHKPRNLK